jgi:hypothetical protein
MQAMRELIDQLMSADDASGLSFFKFAEQASEEILYTDTDDCQAVQIVLALIRGDTELALEMADRYEAPLRNLAEQMLSIHIEKQRQR